MSLAVLNMDDFREVIKRHDTSNQITLLRNLVTTNKDAIADYLLVGSKSRRVKSTADAMKFGPYPGSETLTRAAFDSALVGTNNEKVFDPWNGWWTGKWADGSNQFHIWDRTVFDSESSQWVQPVTQSTKNFAFLRSGTSPIEDTNGINVSDSDVAINVWSSGKGITGWVSKKEAKVELPHVGYLLNSSTLLWFTIYGSDYFMFLERIIDNGAKYSIYGRPFTIQGSKLVVNPGNISTHHGTYESYRKIE